MFKKLTDHLFFRADTCNVYGIVADGRVLLIDCGTHVLPPSSSKAEVAGILPSTAASPGEQPVKDIAVQQVEQIMLTHFHRDSCSAAAQWKRSGARIIVPFAERRFFEETDLLKAAYDIYDNYTSYYPGRGSMGDIIPDHYAFDYESLSWRGIRCEVIPLPGHTFGSVGYLSRLKSTVRHARCVLP